MRRVGRVAKAETVAGPRARRMRGVSLPTWTAISHSRARWFGSSSTTLIIDGLGLAVVIDVRVSRKVGRDINKRISSRRDPRPFLLGIILAPLS